MKTRKSNHTQRMAKIGPRAQKVLLLLQAGIVISLTTRPDKIFRIIEQTHREIKAIDQRTLKNAIANLYQSKLINYKENQDKTVTLTLTDNGKQKALQYNLETMTINKPDHWDGLWRIVAFDIPERFKKGRYALSATLRKLGFYPMQRSVLVYPYECANEIDFIVEVFNLRPYVRLMTVKEIDIDLHLKHKFGLF